ncbi:MAG: protein kinase domain-containing protein, partial [Candidatus Xenobia bacterium]
MLTVGSILHSEYRVDGTLGHPGGSLYQGWALGLQRPVVIKVQPRGAGAAQQAAFRTSAALLGTFTHRNLPQRYGFLEEGTSLYLVREFIVGRDLASLCPGGGVSEAEALAWMGQLCDVLEYLHAQSPPVVHRDIRPEHLIWGDDGILRLSGFTVMQLETAPPMLRPGGSPAYAPPEQYSHRVDRKADIYGLGATLYHLLTGAPPSPAMAFVTGAASADPRQLKPAIRPSIAEAVMAMLRVDHSVRLQAIAEVRTALFGQRGMALCGAPTLRVGGSTETDGQTLAVGGPALGPAGQVASLLGTIVNSHTGQSFQLLTLIGRGASSCVFEAAPMAEPTRRVAIKLMLDPLDAGTDGRTRFEREVAISARLEHPAVVKVLDWGSMGQNPFMVMEQVQGQTFQEILQKSQTGNLPVHQALTWMIEVLSGIGIAHAAGVIHRDIKPSNLMLAGDGQVKILDFGIARAESNVSVT